MNKEFTEAFIEELSKQAALPAIFAKYLPKMTKFLTRFPRTVKGFYKGFASIPGMPRWRAGLKALKFGTRAAPRSAIPYYGGIGALGLGGLGTAARRRLRTKKGEVMDKLGDVFVGSFVDEIEKISKQGGSQATLPVEKKKFKKGVTKWWLKKKSSLNLLLNKIGKASMALGEGGRSEKLIKKFSKRPGIYSPGGLMASIGRAKHGKKKFQAMAAAGKK